MIVRVDLLLSYNDSKNNAKKYKKIFFTKFISKLLISNQQNRKYSPRTHFTCILVL